MLIRSTRPLFAETETNPQNQTGEGIAKSTDPSLCGGRSDTLKNTLLKVKIKL